MLDDLFQGALPELERPELGKRTQGLIQDDYKQAMQSEQQLANRANQGVDQFRDPVQESYSGPGMSSAIARKYNQVAGMNIDQIKSAAKMAAIGQRANNLQRSAQLLIAKQRGDTNALAMVQQARFQAQAARSRAIGQLLNVGAQLGGYGAGGGFNNQQQQSPPQMQQPTYTQPEVGQSFQSAPSAPRYNTGANLNYSNSFGEGQ